MKSNAKTASEYLKELPIERQKEIEIVRNIILKNLAKGFEETMLYGMITYVVPLKTYPKGYKGDGKSPLPYLSLSSQKNYMAVYLMNLYGDKKLSKWFAEEYKKSGKKLDMGLGCLRFKKVDDLPLPLIGKVAGLHTVPTWITQFEKARSKVKSDKR